MLKIFCKSSVFLDMIYMDFYKLFWRVVLLVFCKWKAVVGPSTSLSTSRSGTVVGCFAGIKNPAFLLVNS
jgi:hypothetical protein